MKDNEMKVKEASLKKISFKNRERKRNDHVGFGQGRFEPSSEPQNDRLKSERRKFGSKVDGGIHGHHRSRRQHSKDSTFKLHFK